MKCAPLYFRTGQANEAFRIKSRCRYNKTFLPCHLLLILASDIIDPFQVRLGRHDIQHNGTQHNDDQHNDIQHNDIQHNDSQHNDSQYNDTQHNDIHQKNK
jgi:hypothetical protein